MLIVTDKSTGEVLVANDGERFKEIKTHKHTNGRHEAVAFDSFGRSTTIFGSTPIELEAHDIPGAMPDDIHEHGKYKVKNGKLEKKQKDKQ